MRANKCGEDDIDDKVGFGGKGLLFMIWDLP